MGHCNVWCSTFYSILVVLLILLCGDVELNPGPVMGKIYSCQLIIYCNVVELTAINAWTLLKDCGFRPERKWNELGRLM